MMAAKRRPRAVGVSRQSRGDGASIETQNGLIVAAAEREGFDLLGIREESNISGGASLDRRHGLREAVEMVERGEADVIVAAYFDRFFRNTRVQAEVLERIEKAKGKVLAVDVGEVSGETAAQWLSAALIGAVSEYLRHSTRDRTREKKAAAVKAGVPPFPWITPAFQRVYDTSGRCVGIEPHPTNAPIVAEAVRMRASGATILQCQDYLAGHGIKRSYRAVRTTLSSPLLVGEIRHGEHVNPKGCEPIIDRRTWRRANEQSVPKGGHRKMERLLNKMGLVRCSTCGETMSTRRCVNQKGLELPFYVCSRPGAHPGKRAMISAAPLEDYVWTFVEREAEGIVGRASADEELQQAETGLDKAERKLENAIRSLADLDPDEVGVVETLAGLREERDRRRDHVERLRGLSGSAAVVITASDREGMILAAQRSLVRLFISSVVVDATMPRAALDRRVVVTLRDGLA